MKVSFVTTVRNEQQTIKSYLQSLAAQTRAPDEVIIVDGGSVDGTVEEIRACTHLFPSLSLIVQACNISEGRNIAVRRANADVITMSDAGCELDTRWLEEIVRPLGEDPTVDVVAGNWDIKEEPGLRNLFRWYYLRKYPEFRHIAKNPPMPSARSFAIRRSVWLELGGHPEYLYTGEDTLFNKKWQAAKKKAVFAERAICYWVMMRNLRGFGKQLSGYGRGVGRCATRSSLEILNWFVKWSLALAVMLTMVALGLLSGYPWNICVCIVAIVGSLTAMIKRSKTDFRRAREYGFNLFQTLGALALTYYGTWKRVEGIWKGLRDRCTGHFDEREIEYLVKRLDANGESNRGT